MFISIAGGNDFRLEVSPLFIICVTNINREILETLLAYLEDLFVINRSWLVCYTLIPRASC